MAQIGRYKNKLSLLFYSMPLFTVISENRFLCSTVGYRKFSTPSTLFQILKIDVARKSLFDQKDDEGHL